MEKSRRRHVQLYSESLTHFCKDNTLYLELLKDHVEELDKLKQCDASLKQSKAENDVHRLSKAGDPRNLAVMFTQMDPTDDRLFKAPARPGEYEDLLTSHQHKAENPFCYLCSTAEQHKKHLMKTEKRIHGKKKIPYEAPAPFVPPKPPPPEPQAKDCLFKVTVKTGCDIEAACAEPVYISLLGEEDKLRRVRLVKKFGSLAFFFDSDSTEVFHLRGPHIGQLEQLTLKLGDDDDKDKDEASEADPKQHQQQRQQRRASRRRRKWLVESVSVKDYGLGLEYHFAVDAWLRAGGSSRRDGRRRDCLKLAPTSTVKSIDGAAGGRSVVVTVHTGPKATAGTDCRVYISLLGSGAGGRVGRYELRQPQDAGGRIFQAGGKDAFELHVDDFGELKGIRLEIDLNNVRPTEKDEKRPARLGYDRDKTLEASRTWFVDQVIVKDVKSGKKWLFTIADWLNEDKPSKEFWTVKDASDQLGGIYNQKTRYEVVTKTGKKDFAGTDSTIYLTLFDKENRRCEIELKDEDKSKFEKGKTDTVVQTARVIDTPERLKVSISGTGVAPDWHMEGIVITKHLVMEEMLQYLQRLQFSNKMPDGLTQDKGKILFEATAEAGDTADTRRKKLQQQQQRKKTSDGRLVDQRDQKKKVQAKEADRRRSSRDQPDGDVAFGRQTKQRQRPAQTGSRRRRKLDGLSSDDSDSEASSKASDSEAASVSDDDGDDKDSVESHDDFDPGHGTVRMPYAIRVEFAPRSKEEAWLKKGKSVELRSSGAGKMLFRELRLRSDNESFERLRQEMLEKQRAEEAAKKKRQQKRQKRLEEQRAAKRAAGRSRSKSPSGSRRGKRPGSSDSSDSSSSSSDGRVGKPAGKKQPLLGRKSPSRQTKKKRKGSDSSDSDSSLNAFGKTNTASKTLQLEKKLAKPLLDDDVTKPRGASATKRAEDARVGAKDSMSLRASVRSPRTASGARERAELDGGLDRVDFDKDRGRLDLDKDRGRTGLDKDRGRLDLDKDRGRLDLDKDRGRTGLDKDRGRFDLDRDRGRLDLDKERGRTGLEKDRGRLDLDKDRGRLDLDKDRGRTGLDKDRGRLDLDKDRGRTGLDKDRGRLDLDKDRGRTGLDKDRGRLDLDKDRGRTGLDKDRARTGLDKDRGRLDLDRDRSRLDLDKDRGRLDLDRDRGRTGLDKDRGRLDLDRDRGQLDLDRDRGRLDLDRNRGRLDLDKSQGRSPRDLDRGRLDLDRESSRGGLDRGLGRLDLDNGQDRRSPRDLDRSRGRLDLDRGQDLGRPDLDRGRGRLDLDKGRSPRDLDRSQGGRLDLDRRGAAPLDNPRILVTATDGRLAEPASSRGSGRIRRGSFNLD